VSEAGHVFPRIRARDDLPRRALVVVAHPDDEVIGIGGLLAFHGRRGDAVRVVHATGGGGGDPQGRHDDILRLRRAEVRAALATLGLAAPGDLGFEDGTLGQQAGRLQDRLAAEFRTEQPPLVYTFFGGEYHADHRALARAACAARDALPAGCRVLLFGVNHVPPFAELWDYSDLVERKKAALTCFRSQLAYLDFASKVMHRDQAATVNVELPEVTHAELLVEVDRTTWPQHLARMDSFLPA
jgi:LmbE family N-acetylglucosaminyl deacetylase